MHRPLDFSQLTTFPLQQRKSLSRVEDILLDPDASPRVLDSKRMQDVASAAASVYGARQHGSSVILMYGAHLLRNGAALILSELMQRGWVTHIATNGAGTIHDWEFAWLGRSTESVEENVANGTFGTWEETGRSIHVALLAGGVAGEGYGTALGRFIAEDGVFLPGTRELSQLVAEFPADPRAAACADLLRAKVQHDIPDGRYALEHRWKHASILASAFQNRVTATVHPGIGYDIIACHPMFNGAAIGRAAEIDFKLFAGAVEQLDGGVVLSIGSAIMAPQVFEKSLSCVHNLRSRQGRASVKDFSIYVVDLQDGGNWDWTQGEPPKDNPAYYLRFCKSFSRMGGAMHYVQCDNVAFVHNLLHELRRIA